MKKYRFLVAYLGILLKADDISLRAYNDILRVLMKEEEKR